MNGVTELGAAGILFVLLVKEVKGWIQSRNGQDRTTRIEHGLNKLGDRFERSIEKHDQNTRAHFKEQNEALRAMAAEAGKRANTSEESFRHMARENARRDRERREK